MVTYSYSTVLVGVLRSLEIKEKGYLYILIKLLFVVPTMIYLKNKCKLGYFNGWWTAKTIFYFVKIVMLHAYIYKGYWTRGQNAGHSISLVKYMQTEYSTGGHGESDEYVFEERVDTQSGNCLSKEAI